MLRLPRRRTLSRSLAVTAFAFAALTLSTASLTGCSDDRGGVTEPEEVEEGGQSEPPM